MESFNFVNRSNYVAPKYDISGRKPWINLYFNNGGEIVIVGNVDNNYIYWLSVTKTEDLQTNERIFNYVAAGNILGVTQQYKALEQAGISYAELKNYYCVKIMRSSDGKKWHTPFGCYYGEDNAAQHGMFFARSVKYFVGTVHRKCEQREAGGKYEAVLEIYLQQLKTADSYDYRVQLIEEILKSEDYLILSENENIRRLYSECIGICGKLYNDYMTASR